MSHHDTAHGDSEDQRHPRFPDVMRTLYRRDQVCSDDRDNRRKHSIYDDIFETPRSPPHQAYKTTCTNPKNAGYEYVDQEQHGSASCTDHRAATFPLVLPNLP